MNQTVNGTSATASTRSIHQWWKPDRADPRPRARPRGERRISTCGVSDMDCPYQIARPTTQISTEQTPVAMSTVQDKSVYCCFSNPKPTSQARWRIPLKKWYIRATVQPNRQNSPTGDPMNHCTVSNAWS